MRGWAPGVKTARSTRRFPAGRRSDGGDEPCPNKRRLAASRWAEHGEEAGLLELFEEPLDVGVAPEEELGVLLLEGAKAAIGGGDAVLLRGRPWGRGGTTDRIDQRAKGRLALVATAEVDPWAGAEEGRKGVRVERLGNARKEHDEKTECGIPGGTVVSERQLLVLPVDEVGRADEHRARARSPKSGDHLLRPAGSRRRQSCGDTWLQARARRSFSAMRPTTRSSRVWW